MKKILFIVFGLSSLTYASVGPACGVGQDLSKRFTMFNASFVLPYEGKGGMDRFMLSEQRNGKYGPFGGVKLGTHVATAKEGIIDQLRIRSAYDSVTHLRKLNDAFQSPLALLYQKYAGRFNSNVILYVIGLEHMDFEPLAGSFFETFGPSDRQGVAMVGREDLLQAIKDHSPTVKAWVQKKLGAGLMGTEQTIKLDPFFVSYMQNFVRDFQRRDFDLTGSRGTAVRTYDDKFGRRTRHFFN